MFWQLTVFRLSKIAKFFKDSKELKENAFREQFQQGNLSQKINRMTEDVFKNM